MQIKSIVAGAAIALAATVGSASAADQFATLGGVTAEPMNAMELDSIRGTKIALVVVDVSGSNIFVTEVDPTGNAPPPIVVVESPALGGCFVVAQFGPSGPVLC